MTTRKITLSIALLTVLASHYAMAMKRKPIIMKRKFSSSMQFVSCGATVHSFANAKWDKLSRGVSYSYPCIDESIYQSDFEAYEKQFRKVLTMNVSLLKSRGKLEIQLKNYEESLLQNMQRHKQHIIKNLITSKYYPRVKSIEWKK